MGPYCIHAEGVTFSNSHTATCSACGTLPISRDARGSYFYSTAREVPCGSVDTNKGLFSWAGHPPEHVSLARPEKFSHSPPLFLGKDSRRTSEKETGLLKS